MPPRNSRGIGYQVDHSITSGKGDQLGQWSPALNDDLVYLRATIGRNALYNRSPVATEYPRYLSWLAKMSLLKESHGGYLILSAALTAASLIIDPAPVGAETLIHISTPDGVGHIWQGNEGGGKLEFVTVSNRQVLEFMNPTGGRVCLQPIELRSMKTHPVTCAPTGNESGAVALPAGAYLANIMADVPGGWAITITPAFPLDLSTLPTTP
jgi:hypothetical protein